MIYGIFNLTLGRFVLNADSDSGIEPYTARNRESAEAAMLRVMALARGNPEHRNDEFEVRPYRKAEAFEHARQWRAVEEGARRALRKMEGAR